MAYKLINNLTNVTLNGQKKPVFRISTCLCQLGITFHDRVSFTLISPNVCINYIFRLGIPLPSLHLSARTGLKDLRSVLNTVKTVSSEVKNIHASALQGNTGKMSAVRVSCLLHSRSSTPTLED